MERGLSLAGKVTLVGPMLTGHASIKGTKAWEAYRRVVLLRNELLHRKYEAENNPDDPSPFGDFNATLESLAVALAGRPAPANGGPV